MPVFTGSCQVSTHLSPLLLTVPFLSVPQSSYTLAHLLWDKGHTSNAQQRCQGAGEGSRTCTHDLTDLISEATVSSANKHRSCLTSPHQNLHCSVVIQNREMLEIHLPFLKLSNFFKPPFSGTCHYTPRVGVTGL